MSARRRAGTLAAVVLAALAAGCGGVQGDGLSRARSEHGIALGDRIESPPLACEGDGERTLGETGATQIVTFATPYDCVLCNVHLSGVQEVLSRPELRGRSFMVVWAPKVDMARRAFAAGGTRPALPLCVDQAGHVWDTYQITTTPFTVVLKGGRVVYITDQPVGNAERRREFVRDLEAVLGS